jgi:hypothetical protein
MKTIPLPEFSALVMPASKGFEGFAKKLVIGIRLVKRDHFDTPSGNFSILNDKTNPKRVSVCNKDKKYADKMLNKLNLCLDQYRNFMMHSDSENFTKVDIREDAEKRYNRICDDTKDLFEYFNNLYELI